MKQVQHTDYDSVADANNLMKSGKKCIGGVSWKYSTQNFYLDRIRRVRKSKERLDNMERMSDGFTTFKINERGKIRNIRSVHINERIVQKAHSELTLVPRLRPKLVYDNYASLEGRGIQMAFDRLKVHLWRYYRKHGNNEGYILVADLHAYFDSIDHDCVYEQLSKVFKDDLKSLYLTMDFVDAFGDKSLGLGSQVSQILAMFYPNKIDHYIKEVLKIEGFGRYNDDFILIHEDKAYLQYCLDKIIEMYGELGIELNQNKTKICKLSTGFKFLKTKVHLTETGRVVIRPDRKSIVRERRKLKKLKTKLDAGEIEFEEVRQQYMSWRGYIVKFDSYKTLKDMDKLFDKLFIFDWHQSEQEQIKKKRRNSYNVKYGDKQSPACRRHGLELEAEWD